jgi:rhamnosyltransferase
MMDGVDPDERESAPASSKPYYCSLVIPTKNGGPLFKRVIAGLQSQHRWQDVEFIVVDSQSDDDTVETARAAGAKILEIPASSFNHGATRDFAISQASSNMVVLLVQDAVPNDPYVLERLVETLQEKGVAGAYARQIPQPDADVITARNLNIHLTGRMERDEHQISDPAALDAMTPMDRYVFCNFDNVCSALRKDVWERERFGRINFGEDIDWSERVLRRGHKIVYEPKAAVIHSHDRPMEYEYKRSYVCHRKLVSQFGLKVFPTLKSALNGWYHLTKSDMTYVMRAEKGFGRKIALLFKTPILNFLRILGQYQAVRDEERGTAKTVRGV